VKGTSAVPGQVVAVDGSRVKVRVRRHGTCGRTHRCPWNAAFQLLPGGVHLEIEAEAVGPLRPGDTVLVTTESRYVVKSWLLGFGLPLAGALAGAVAGARLAGTDLGAAAGMAAGLAGGWWGLSRLSRRLAPASFRATRHEADPCAAGCPLSGADR